MDIWLGLSVEEESLILSIAETNREAAIARLREVEVDADSMYIIRGLISKLGAMKDADYRDMYASLSSK